MPGVTGLEAWLETMRSPGGYGGPVAHWWQQSLMYTGPSLDWRYEGIIMGYLQLWRRACDERWLMKARRAGDDLVAGQIENGHYAASAFELNPATAGTPHEAACDIGLLQLADALRNAGRIGWERYAACAERNLREFYVKQLWDTETLSFRDSPYVPSFVPNKAATVCEALFLLTGLSGDGRWVERYAIPTLKRILEHQVKAIGRLDGAIAQNSFGEHRIEKYFPIYIARCIPVLLCGYNWTNDERYVESALRAMEFITRWAYPDGTFPTVVYANLKINRYPSWIAALGDVLRAAEELRSYGFDADLSPTLDRLLRGQDTSGAIQTAYGFAAQGGGRLSKVPDVRDVLHVAGWCDKAFRYLASQVAPGVTSGTSGTFEVQCTFRGQLMQLVETPELLEVSRGDRVFYRWQKGELWPDIAAPEFWLR